MKRIISTLLVLCASGCIDPDFELPSIVRGPRVLSVIADRPEAAPGDDVRVHALVVDPENRAFELRWSMCLGNTSSGGPVGGAATFGASSPEQFGEASQDPGCDPLSPLTTELLVEGDEAIVPGECADPSEPWRCTRGIIELASAFGEESGMSAELLERILDLVGITLSVQVDVYLDGELEVTAFKRIAITRRAVTTTNPPPPRFAVGDVWVSARDGGDPHECVPERGVPPVVSGVSEIHLRPDEDHESWLETFPVVALDGSVIEGRENAYYAWFSTVGEFDPEVSVATETIWITPEERGVHPVWVVVRDGHLGQSACRVDVEVVDVVPPYGNIERF